jgi:DNA-binding beta-propeller fold protein YncE
VLLVSALAMPALFVSGRQRAIPAEDQPSIPTRVYPPMPFPSTVQDAPAGPAALIVTGRGGFGTIEVLGYEDRAIVVGQNGSYRVVRHNQFAAGKSLLLSPDGRFVAGDGGLEGARPGTDFSATSVLDLTTGQVHSYDAGQPLAWSPDGRSLLARSGSGNLSVVDVDAKAVVDLDLYGGEPTSPTWVAFSPDGRRAALQEG